MILHKYLNIICSHTAIKDGILCFMLYYIMFTIFIRMTKIFKSLMCLTLSRNISMIQRVVNVLDMTKRYKFEVTITQIYIITLVLCMFTLILVNERTIYYKICLFEISMGLIMLHSIQSQYFRR